MTRHRGSFSGALTAIWVASLKLAWISLAADVPRGDDEISGVVYRHLSEAGPQSIHVVSFDLANKDLALTATAGTSVWGNETVADMVAGLPDDLGRPVAAINGDYFEFKGEPRFFGTLQGMCVADGEMIASPPASAFWVDIGGIPRLGRVAPRFTMTWPDGRETPFSLNCSTRDFMSEVRAVDVVLYTPAFGPSTHASEGALEWVLRQARPDGAWLPMRPDCVYTARVDEVIRSGDTSIPGDGMVLSVAKAAATPVPTAKAGETVTFRTGCEPAMSGVRTAIGGDPLLLANGVILTRPDPTNRAPRTAVGLAGTRVWFVVVDGRQRSVAIGMGHHELAQLMQRLGCTDAMNMDGGGSSTLWHRGRVVNSLSDGALRPVGNALVLCEQR